MPKCRTGKSAYHVVKARAVHFYSIKNMPYGKIYYANSSIDVLIYIPHLVSFSVGCNPVRLICPSRELDSVFVNSLFSFPVD